MCRLAGEIADGFHVHPFHTRRYVQQVVVPQIEAGLARSARQRRDFTISAGVFVVTGSQAEVNRGLADIRRHLAFYASTPSYRGVLDLHGWGETGERLSRLAARREWEAMPALVSTEMLEACAIWGPPDEAAARLRAEYGGLVERLTPYEPLVADRGAETWRALITALR
jgi:probable F420-dependent oxidoreductase